MSSSDDVRANMDFIREHGENLEPGSILILPEMWSFLVPDARGAERAAFAQEHSQSVRDFMSSLAKKLNITLIGGSSFEWLPEQKKVVNRCLVFNPEGQCSAQYDKMHLFDNGLSADAFMESRTVCAGATPAFAAWNGHKMGLSICYDLRFSNLYAHYSSHGAFAISAPSAFAARTGKDHWELLVRTRAIENQCFIWATNQCGLSPAGVKCWGHSLIVDPWGEILAEAGSEPELIQVQCSLKRVDQVRRLMPVLSHRRTIPNID
jgi:deaminated glutathione amidase